MTAATTNPIGICSIMLHDRSPDEAIAVAAAEGVTGIEWRVTETGAGRGTDVFTDNRCTLRFDEVTEVTARCRRHGLEVIGLDTYVECGDLATAGQAAAVAADAGVPWFRFRAPWRDGTPWNELADRARRFVDDLETISRRHGVRALLELHQRTICPSASLTRRVVGHADPARVGVIYDAGNLLVEGYEDHDTAVELLGPHLAHVHLKNARWVPSSPGRPWRLQWSRMDDGLLDLPALRTALDRGGYQGWLSLEDFTADLPPASALRVGVEALRAGRPAAVAR
ncbi:sugar phosphate isomerase/epimerase [Pseudonocardia sp. C8]|uniref:sugar phosphate isomerase/epimerase family protein n=1 Tax=Pseudonocardia sp. C8 TaxID=2762759 RepID=UPI0016425478|nr:sugar phosphate isomerase/epimerase family protein [Pseudonocardia sp. C8]MBC3190133.1 sugar phosphate isomerase/epimerase [Pseudonocardia sp. C8]